MIGLILALFTVPTSPILECAILTPHSGLCYPQNPQLSSLLFLSFSSGSKDSSRQVGGRK